MPGDSQRRPPAACRCLLSLAGAMVPRESRASWREKRRAGMESLWVLAERGEISGDRAACLAWFLRDSFRDAFRARCGGLGLRRWAREPAFLVGVVAVVLVLLTTITHGFSVTRWLLHGFAPGAGIRVQDHLVAHIFAGLFAAITALMTAFGRLSMRGHDWRYYGFLAFKTLALTAILYGLWIEGGAALRSFIPGAPLRILAGSLLLTLAFVIALDWTVVWSLGDQQHRCPVCLRRLILPVRIGSWASVLEPVTTEWVCEEGHGSLCIHETPTGPPDRWIAQESPLTAKSS